MDQVADAATPPDAPLSDRVVVITGAGSGIGQAVAIACARAGARLALLGRRADALEATRARAGLEAARALILPLDVADPDGVARAFDAVVERFGRVDVLFNNAGTGAAPADLEDVPFEQWGRVVATNITGPWLCTQAAMRVMKAQVPRGGRIINNGSISAHTPRPKSAPYTISKHAISGLTKATALEGRAFDIACGQIDIGNAATDMTKRMAKGTIQADGSIAPEPLMDVDHVARAFLAMATLPLEANVLSMTIMATAMPYVGRG